jgi:excisionase family DNA binding protein
MVTQLKTVQIVSSPNVLDGKPCIENRRISVEQVVEHHLYEGWSIERLEQSFSLRPAEIYAALAYYYDHRDEIDAAIHENDEAFEDEDGRGSDQEQLLNLLENYLSTRQVAQKLGISERRVRQLCDEGRIPAKKVGINWFIHPSALDLDEVKNRKPGRPGNEH